MTPISLRVSMQDTVEQLSVAVVMQMGEFTSLYDTLVDSGDQQVNNVITYIAIVFFVLLVIGVV